LCLVTALHTHICIYMGCVKLSNFVFHVAGWVNCVEKVWKGCVQNVQATVKGLLFSWHRSGDLLINEVKIKFGNKYSDSVPYL